MQFDSEYPANTWNWNKVGFFGKIMWKYKSDMPKKFIQEIKSIYPDGRVLDMACGMGRNARCFARNGFKTTGLDIDNEPLEMARKRAQKDKLDINYVQGDMMNMPFDNNSFDFIMAMNIFSLTHTQGLIRTIDEIHRVLDTDGRLFGMIYLENIVHYKALSQIDDYSIMAQSGNGKAPAPFCFLGNVENVKSIFQGFDLKIDPVEKFKFCFIRACKTTERVYGKLYSDLLQKV